MVSQHTSCRRVERKQARDAGTFYRIGESENARQNRNIKTGNKSFEWMENFKFLLISVTYNHVYEEIESRLKSGNGCCYSVQNILSSHLLSANIKIELYRV